jgi:phosphomannomutase / phosphoglucomutase
MSIYKACDIRAVYGTELKGSDAEALGYALAALKGPVDIVVGGDARLSTPVLKLKLIEALVNAGCRVHDLGMIATPVFYFALQYLSIPTGVMVTASHNPPQYNGFKFILGDLPITQAEMGQVRELMESGSCNDHAGGELYSHDLNPAYLDVMLAQIENCSDLKIVVDYGHGMGAQIGPALWSATGAEVFPLFAEVDGNFPGRSPNPAVAANLDALCDAVLCHRADLGAAYDGDGDRFALVDDQGRVVGNDQVIALFAGELLKKEPAVVIYDQKCSTIVPERVRQLGGDAFIERSGHTFIKTAFVQKDAVYAGELSGHHFFRSLPQGDDGVMASIFLAAMLAREGCPLSEWLGTLPKYPVTPDIRISVQKGEAERILQKLSRGLAQEAKISELDGVRAEFDDGWGLARLSVTEPMITLRFEGANEIALRRILGRFEELVPELANRLLVYAERSQ